MSRKWERMVERNKKKANIQRTKEGKKPLDRNNSVPVVYGRSYFFPAVLLLFAIFIMSGFRGVYQTGTLYWVTILSYVLLAAFFFFRRPYIRIGKDGISTRRFRGNVTLSPKDIQTIEIDSGYVQVQGKKSRDRWVFSRLLQRYNTDRIAEYAIPFAQKNQIELINKMNQEQEQEQKQSRSQPSADEKSED